MSNEVRCRVCNEKSDGSHFGIDSCRACAAFFRRTVNLKRSYVCRLGTNNCNISNSVRCMCRSCRFKKCLECGMLAENVQPKRDSLKNSVEATNSGNTNDVLSPSSSLSENENRTVVMRAPNLSNDCTTSSSFLPASVPHAGFDSIFSNSLTRQQDFFKNIQEGYKKLNESRRTAEITLSMEPIENVFATNPNIEIKSGNFEYITKVHRADIPLIADFLESTFEAFACLHQQQKWIVFHNFVCHLWGLEGCFRTMRQFPPDNKERIMLTMTSYLDLNEINSFFYPQKVDEAVAKVMTETFLMHLSTAETMRSINITDTEFAALIALTLFSESIEGVTPDTMNVIRSMRELTFHNLHQYYIEGLGVPNYACRLGECLILLSVIQKVFLDMAEGIELARLYDLFDKDCFMYHFIKS
uniref:Nuclear receptor n=1 Tax=Syphacia muris TaxID=451379 RepID=A0A0N5AW11_9BILA